MGRLPQPADPVVRVHRFDSTEGARPGPEGLGYRNPTVTVGVFDGVHRGHQHLISTLREWSEQRGGGDVVVITFQQHPLSVLGRIPPAALTSLDHRLLLLERAGVDGCLILDFDRELASWSAERFVEEIVRKGLGARHLVLGFNAAVGAGARGTAEYLSAIPDLGVEVRGATPFLVDGRAVSSTDIRAAVLKGELEEAERMLGRPVAIYGEVIHGDGRGRSLGFPTANLNLFHSAAPPHGVYVAEVEVEGGNYGALVNIGRRPTFMRADDPLDYSRYYNEQLDKVEVFVHGFEGDLYERRLEAVLHDKLRDERRFENSQELVVQIQRDVQSLLDWCARRRG